MSHIGRVGRRCGGWGQSISPRPPLAAPIDGERAVGAFWFQRTTFTCAPTERKRAFSCVPRGRRMLSVSIDGSLTQGRWRVEAQVEPKRDERCRSLYVYPGLCVCMYVYMCIHMHLPICRERERDIRSGVFPAAVRVLEQQE